MEHKLKNVIICIFLSILSLIFYISSGSELVIIVFGWVLALLFLSILDLKNYLNDKISKYTIIVLIILSAIILIYDFKFILEYYIFTLGLIIYAILIFREILNNNKNPKTKR